MPDAGRSLMQNLQPDSSRKGQRCKLHFYRADSSCDDVGEGLQTGTRPERVVRRAVLRLVSSPPIGSGAGVALPNPADRKPAKDQQQEKQAGCPC